jgi:cell division protein FtsN/nucleoid DNA-binding protein
MMDINLHISKLLFTHNRVVVPNFGVFEIEVQEAYNHPVSNEFTPKFKKIKFLKNFEAKDDLLERTIEGESKNIITDFVESLKKELKENKQFEFKNIGIVKMHSSGALIFEQEMDFNYEKSFFGLKAFTAIPVVINEEIPVTPIAVEDEKPKRKLVWLWISMVAAAAIIAVLLIFQEQIFVKNTPVVVKQEEPVTPDAQSITPNLDTNDSMVTETTIADTVAVDSNIDSVESQEIAKVDVPEKSDVKPVAEVTPQPESNKKYYVIAGCFRSDDKAQEYLQEIIQKGYTEASIEGKTSGGLIRVCYAGFERRSKAKSFMEETAVKESKSLWIQKITH